MPRPPPPAEAFKITGYPIPPATLDGFFRGLRDARRARQDGHARVAHERARALLDAHQPDHVRPRSDELQPGDLAHFREARIFAQETIAGMDGVGPGDLRGADDRWDIQIAAGTLGRTDADGFVGEAHVQAVAVGLRVDRYRPYAQFLAGAHDTQRDFAAIGDQDFLNWSGWQTTPPRTPRAVRSSPVCFR